jgi:peptide/nickel transport system substrate-binding protein
MAFNWKRTAFALGVGASLSLTALAVPPVQAETPPNMLVMGMRIDDIITLDPAEVFELSAGEISANIYDRVMMFEPEDLTTLVGGVVESWQISDDGKTITFKMRPSPSRCATA